MEVIEEKKQKDLEELKIVKEVLINVSKQVYRNIKFFYESQNKMQRRKIYNQEVEYKPNEFYGIVCQMLCKIVQKICVEQYGLKMELIKCDTDEFAHVDVLLTTKSGNKYIINCLSDLERIQVGMKTKRFASKEYFNERYSHLLDESEISFLSDEDNKIIDEQIGYFKHMYMDDFFEIIKQEFKNLKESLKTDDDLRKLFLGKDSTIEDVDNITEKQLLNLKVKFLLDFCNKRKGLIGHIELIRIYKLLSKELFSSTERKMIKAYDCFFDKGEKELKGIWDIPGDRIRFLKIQIGEIIYILTVKDNSYLQMNPQEYEEFKKDNHVFEKNLSRLSGKITESIRNKGVGINVLKHPYVYREIVELDNMALNLPKEEIDKVVSDIASSDERNISFTLLGCEIGIELSPANVRITKNGKSVLYGFENDDLIITADTGVKQCIRWIGEGKYEEYKKETEGFER